MSQIDNLNNSQLTRVLREVRSQSTSAPMNNAAIGRGGVEVYDGGVINVSNGNLIVNGTATISGVLNADGTVTLSGVVNVSGPFTVSGATDITGPLTIAGATDITGNTDVTGDFQVTGPTHLEGATDITGALSVEGVTTLTGDMNVIGGGQIRAGNVNITPSASNGGIEFTSGGGVGANGGAITVKASGNVGMLAGTMATLFAGATSLDVRTDGVYVTLPTTTQPANLYADSSGKLYKSNA